MRVSIDFQIDSPIRTGCMASQHDAFTLIGKRMQSSNRPAHHPVYHDDMPAIADLIRRIDQAVQERRAA